MLPYSHVAPDASTLLPQQSSEVLCVAVAGSDALARAAVASLLSTFDDLAVICDDVELDESAESRLSALDPDVVVCDLGSDDAPLVRLPVASLLLVRGRADAAELIASGTRGVVDGRATGKQLRAAIRAISEGLIVYDAAVSSRGAAFEHDGDIEPLTAREREVLQLLSAGLTNKEIAQRLGITEHTVKFHVNAILGKLAAETRTEAVVQAAKRGLIVL